MKKRIDSLQVLRAFAFLEIFLGHCGIPCFSGAFGVSIFIVLSGFCMAVNRLQTENQMECSLMWNVKYAISKVKKLYGLHLMMLAAVFVMVKMPTSASAIKRLLMDVLLIQCWSPYAEDFFSFNGVSWYLAVYFYISLLAPYLMQLLKKLKSRKQVIFTAVVVYLVMLIAGYFLSVRQIPIGDNFAFWFTYICPVYRILEFFLGAVLGWIYLEMSDTGRENVFLWTLVEILTAVLGCIGLFMFHKMDGTYDGVCYTALFTPISIILVFVFARCKGMLLKILNNPFLLWIGNLSAYMFLIHQVVIRWLRNVLETYDGKDGYLVLITVCSFVVTVCVTELYLHIKKLINKN